MSQGMLTLLTKGGPWAQALFLGSFVWLVLLLLVMALQRRRLEMQFATQATVGGDEPDPDDLACRVRAALDPLSGGLVGLGLVVIWWLFIAAALIWSRTALPDLHRFADDGYLAALTAGTTVRDVVRSYSARLITASMAGIVGVPAAVLTMLAVDQILVRPRTRWLDEARRRALARRGAGVEDDPRVVSLRTRANARWSWTALVLNWAWLFGRGLAGRGTIALVVVVVGSVMGTMIGAAVGLEASTDGRLTPGLEITSVHLVWAPLLLTVLGGVAGWAVALGVAAHGQGWNWRQRQARGDTGPLNREVAARRFRGPLVLIGLALAVVVLLIVSWRPGARAAHPTSSLTAPAGSATDSVGAVAGTVRPELLEYVAPEYPEEARLKGVSGQVLIKILVGADGTVIEAQVLKGADPRLDAAALEAARETRWTPGSQRGVPVKTWMALPYSFTLQ